MIRVIKFRAWDKKVKHMFTWSFPEMLDEHIPRTSDLEWMQFTGLTDKNGKEIYEGDVLGFIASETAPAYLQQVMWDNDAAMFVLEDKDDYKSDFNHWRMNEVIGNIYENPELLETL